MEHVGSLGNLFCFLRYSHDMKYLLYKWNKLGCSTVYAWL